MAPQGVWVKKLVQYTKSVKFPGVLGCAGFVTVLVGQLGAGAMAISPSSGARLSQSNASESLVIAVLDRDTLHQSEPDCKYPPCD